MTRTVYMSLIT